LSRIYYYCGINNRSGDESLYTLAVRNPAGDFVGLASFIKDDSNIWKYNEVVVRTSAVRLTAETPGGRLNEIAFVEKGSRTPLTGLRIAGKNISSADMGKAENIIDEQSAFEYAPSFRTGFYFDEIYHARTAWEMLKRIEPYETTHPPLGKLLISSGIALFGMNPFGWRVVGTLFGVALVPLMYLFGLKLFRNRYYAFCAAFLMMVEFMRFAQSRVAVIDVYGVFFILVMYYFILDLFPEKGERPRRSANLTLLLAGVTFGIGAACKWIVLYAGCGLVLLVVLRTVAELRQRDFPAEYGMAGFLLRRIGVCLVAFGVIPALIYLLAYLPYLALPGPGHGLADVFRLQAHMFNYHRTLQATHPFSSPWWSWPLDLHPMWMYTGTGLPEGTASSIVSFGNPAIFWVGIPSVAVAAFLAVRRRDVGMGVVLAALLCQYLPWVGINRLAFIYHFFSTVPFLILCIVATLRSVELRCPRFRSVTWGYLGIAAGLFILFYPVLSGLRVPQSYVASLRWLPTWFF
ncbi:MAG: phospholipid carrier-dependent glycosyltransferase, partial [Verrucomicrobia bacterium]|nr:phospholipid carrier-dependent glycosyltransferase [Deltaproteobacteria bacterium]